MKNKRIKIWKYIGMTSVFGALIATPIIFTSCSKSEQIPSGQIVTPTFNNQLTYKLALNQVFGIDGTNRSIKTAIDSLLNNHKDILFNNLSSIPQSQQNYIKIDTTIVSGDDSKWEVTTNQMNESTKNVKTIYWAGRASHQDKNEVIVFNSIKELKTKFGGLQTVPIINNALNASGITSTERELNKLDIDYTSKPLSLTKDNNLQIYISIKNKPVNNSLKSELVGDYILEIPQANIRFNPVFNVKVTYGNNQILEKNNLVIYELLTPDIYPSVNYFGNLKNIFGTNGTNTEVNDNVSKIIQNNKSLLISNFNLIQERGQDKDIKIEQTITSGDDSTWVSNKDTGNTNTGQQATKIKWAGRRNQPDAKEILTFNSIKDLKEKINDLTIITIMNNALNNANKNSTETQLKKLVIDYNSKPLKINESNNLEIYVSITDKKTQDQAGQPVALTGDYILEIPQSNILFNPTFDFKITYGENETIVHKNIAFNTNTPKTI